jgi:YVTN family beta-propeller protein
VDDRKIDYRILGSFEVRVGGRLVGLGGEKPRGLLAILLLHRNEVVSVDRLVDDLWGESPPETALRTVRAYVSRLRKALGANGTRVAEEASAPGANGASPAEEADCVPDANGGVLLTRGRGYVLRVAPGEVDLERFEEMTERGRDALAAGNAEEAAALLREALGLWRGPPLSDFAYESFAQAAIAQLEELRLATVEDRVEADLALGHARELVGELRDLVARNPLRERVRGQLMLALYRCGRQAEALEAYREFRRRLSEELGLDPGSPIQQLELAILARDPTLDPTARVGGTGAQAAKARAAIHRLAWVRPRRLGLAVGAVLVLALVVVGALVGWSGGGAAAPAVIPGDSVGAISPSDGAIRAVVPLGTSPSALAAGSGVVWTANYNQGTVSRIDVATRAVVQTIGAGTTPAGVAVGGGSVWVTNNYGGTVSRIDPAVDRVVQTIPVGNAPVGVAVGNGSVWVANSSDGTLTRIDAVSGTVKDTIALGSGATAVAAGAGAVWVSDRAGDRVFRVDPQADQVAGVINVGTGPTALAVGFGSVWVANSLDGTVSRIDPQTNTVTGTVAVGDGAGAVALAGGRCGSRQYAGTVARIDPSLMRSRRPSVGAAPAPAVARGLVGRRAPRCRASRRHAEGAGHGERRHDGPLLTQNLLIVLPLTYDGLTAYQRVGGSGSVQLVLTWRSLALANRRRHHPHVSAASRNRFSNGETGAPGVLAAQLERPVLGETATTAARS